MDNDKPFPRGDRPLPSAWSDNPFQAPTAAVADVGASGDATLAAQPNSLAAGSGWDWFARGWAMFREAPGMWIGVCVVFMIIITVLGAIPFVNVIANIILPVFTGGIMIGCKAIDDGEGLAFGHLFAGFQQSFGRLAMVGALYLGGLVVVVAVLALLVAALGVGASFGGGAGAGFGMAMVLVVLLGAAAVVPLAMAVWFAPALVALHDLSALDAMKLSFRGCLRNLVPFLVFGVVGLVLAVLATIPVALGWLLLVPTMIGASYAAYKDIFLGQ